MERGKNESASLNVIMTLLFLYAAGALTTVFGFVRLMRGEQGVLNGKTLALSVACVCTVLGFCFVSGVLRKKTALWGLTTALALNLTVLPFALYTAPVYALAIFVGQRTGMHYITGYVLYAALQFALYASGYALSALPRRIRKRSSGLAA